jgi:hypothetical protein
MNDHEKKRYLRISDIIGDKERGISPILPMSRGNWLKGVNIGIYPAAVKISRRIHVWKRSDIDNLIKK